MTSKREVPVPGGDGTEVVYSVIKGKSGLSAAEAVHYGWLARYYRRLAWIFGALFIGACVVGATLPSDRPIGGRIALGVLAFLVSLGVVYAISAYDSASISRSSRLEGRDRRGVNYYDLNSWDGEWLVHHITSRYRPGEEEHHRDFEEAFGRVLDLNRDLSARGKYVGPDGSHQPEYEVRTNRV